MPEIVRVEMNASQAIAEFLSKGEISESMIVTEELTIKIDGAFISNTVLERKYREGLFIKGVFNRKVVINSKIPTELFISARMLGGISIKGCFQSLSLAGIYSGLVEFDKDFFSKRLILTGEFGKKVVMAGAGDSVVLSGDFSDLIWMEKAKYDMISTNRPPIAQVCAFAKQGILISLKDYLG